MTKDTLTHRALVLNRSWLAISTTSVRDALVLLYKGAARAVRPETFELFAFESWRQLAHDHSAPFVATVSDSIRVPEVIVLDRYDGFPSRGRGFSRRGVLERDRWTCQYCGKQPGGARLTLDHVQPRSRGGPTTWENCVAACNRCNSNKRDRTPVEAGLSLRRAPERPGRDRVFQRDAEPARECWAPFLEGGVC